MTLTFAASDSWNNDTAPATISSPNARLMNGIIKVADPNGAVGNTGTFTFDNLPAGTYNIYVYMNENGDGTQLNLDDGGTTTFYVTETHQFTDTDVFKEAKNTTDPASGGTRDVGNYVKFSGETGASKTITATHVLNSDGCGIAGFQIVSPSGATPVSLAVQPQSQSTAINKTVTFSVGANGPYTSVQWQKKASGASSFSDIPGATSLSYTTPVLLLADNGSVYHAVFGSASGPVTSADATLTVLNDTTAPTLLSASGSLTKVRLVFSEPLDLTTARAAGNYAIDKSVTVSSATSEEVGSGNNEQTVVTLTVSGATAGTVYTVTVNGVKDTSGNTIAANSTKSFYLYKEVVSVSFEGRDNNSNPLPVGPAEIAGVVSATEWNNVNDKSTTPAENGTTAPLVDSAGAATPITLTFAASDSWNNDTDPTTIKTGSAHMMNGIIKVADPNGATGNTATFTFDNLPDGGYDVYVYMNENGDGTQLNIDDGGATTFYVTETHQFTDSSAFILAQNTTDPDTAGGTRDVGNYVKFTGETATSLTITVTHILNSDGCGIAGFQIVQPSGPTLYLPATIAITAQPQPITVTEGRSGTLSVAATTTSAYGLTYQWKKGGVVIPGATSSSYKLPVQQLSDNNAQYTVDLSALGASTVTSSPVTVTVIADTVPPQLLSAGSLTTFAGGDEVTLVFYEPIAASSSAPLSNFTLNNGAAVTAARIVTNSSGLDTIQSGVILSATGITPGSSYTVTVKGVADLHGNAITTPQTQTFTASPFSWLSLESATNPNSGENDAFAIGTNSFNLVNGGNAFWGTEDDITMVYEKVTGDFDRQAQVQWNDPSSNWARAGLSARESLNAGQPTTDDTGANPASRYQMVLSDPMTKFDGTAANDGWETNRRLDAGGPSTSLSGVLGVVYPNSYVRIKRVGSTISVYYSTNSTTWISLGTTDFIANSVNNPGAGDPLPADMYVGPTLGAENGNITGQGGTADQLGAFAARFRNYGPVAEKAPGTETYAIGLNFGANEAGAQLSTNDVAGVDAVAQKNWNNISGEDSTVVISGGTIVANNGSATPVTVEITDSRGADLGNTWTSEGVVHGEENNLLTGQDEVLMTGYLDTGAATTTKVEVDNIPSNLTTPGYDVIVYALGGAGAKGGSYRITDPTGAVLADYVAVKRW